MDGFYFNAHHRQDLRDYLEILNFRQFYGSQGKTPAFFAAIKLVTKGSKSQLVCALGGKYLAGIRIRIDCLFSITGRITEIGIQA